MTDSELQNFSKEQLIQRIEKLERECNELRARLIPDKPINMVYEAVDKISEAIVIYDANGGLVAWNQTFVELYHYKEDELKPGVHYSELGRLDIERGNVAVGDEFGGGDQYLKRKAEYRKKLEGSFVVQLKDGRWIKTTDRPMGNGGFVSVQVDITDLKKLEDHMRFLAQHDMLTQLPNRNLFAEKAAFVLASAKRQKEKFAILFIDLDGFQSVNETFGRATGDDLLREVSLRLKERMRDSDLIARVGGDEFVVLLPKQFDKSTAPMVTDEILEQIHPPFMLEGKKVELGASVGISYFPEHGDTIDTLMQKAESAMYQAKARGKNCWVISDEQ